MTTQNGSRSQHIRNQIWQSIDEILAEEKAEVSLRKTRKPLPESPPRSGFLNGQPKTIFTASP